MLLRFTNESSIVKMLWSRRCDIKMGTCDSPCCCAEAAQQRVSPEQEMLHQVEDIAIHYVAEFRLID